MRLAPQARRTRDGSPFTLRSARGADSGAILDHLASIHARETASNPAPRYTVDSLRALARDAARADDGCLLVAEAGGRVVATLLARAPGPPVEGPAYAELGLSVQPAWRRRGVARALLATAVDLARGGRLRRLTLRVREENVAATRLYASLGFQRCGRRDGLVTMERDLR